MPKKKSINKEAKRKKRMILRKKAQKGLKHQSLLLLFGFNGFTHELVNPKTNNILLITCGQTTSQEVLKFPIIGTKIFLAWTPTSLKRALYFFGTHVSSYIFDYIFDCSPKKFQGNPWFYSQVFLYLRINLRYISPVLNF